MPRNLDNSCAGSMRFYKQNGDINEYNSIWNYNNTAIHLIVNFKMMANSGNWCVGSMRLNKQNTDTSQNREISCNALVHLPIAL